MAAVCFFWGTTYLGIRVALESFPPLTLVATRFILSGGALLVWAKLRGLPFPEWPEARRTAWNGLLTLGIGNACLTFAETRIASGMAALFITTAPFWMVGLDAAIPGGRRLHGPTIIGMVVGLAGALLLVARNGLGQVPDHALLWGFLVLQFGNLGWSFGSIRQQRMKSKVNPILNGAIQQIATGLAWLLPALVVDAGTPVRWDLQGIGALLYLATFGSIVAYSAFLIAMERLPVALVSLYTYVNPIVAVTLGWLWFREPFGARELTAMSVIFLGVYLVKRFSRA